jgi:lipopolysaccharide transport system permease protein
MTALSATAQRYVNLVFYRTYAELRTESERTYIGFVWWVLEPIISMAVMYLVFKVIMQRGTENFVQFLFIGLVSWRWLETTVTSGASSILNARGLMQQVYLSKLVFPLVIVLTNTFKFVIVFLLLIGFLVVTGFPIGLTYLALPWVLATQLLLILGLGIVFAALTPFLPDLVVVLRNVTRLWFFLSGIFWDIKSFSHEMQEYLRFNPMATIIESYRDILLHDSWPDFVALGLIALACVPLCLLGIGIVRRFDYVYPKLRF